jgi:tetratricopeptide (TPR) repeat protein
VASANGDHARAVANLEDIVRGGFRQAEGRGFDFAKDYTVLNKLAGSLYQLALSEKDGEQRSAHLEEARRWYEQALEYDPENLEAHWGLKQVYRNLGDVEKEREHAERHAYYKPDDNAQDYAVARARMKYPAANRAAEAIVIYDLQRSDAFDIPDRGREVARIVP